MTRISLSAAALALAAFALPAAAQLLPTEEPVSLGPLGGSAVIVVVNELDPDEIIVSKYVDGLYRSTDGGDLFAPFTPPGLPAVVRDIVVDPSDPLGLYAIEGTQVFHSLDFGASWVTLGLVANDNLKGIAVPSSGNTLLAYDAFDVYRSPDGGQTWSVTASEVVIDALEFAPSDSNVAYFTSINGLWRSTDNGQSFQDPNPAFTEWGQCVSVHPSSSSIVFVGTPFNGLLRSIDGGVVFSPVGTNAVTGGNSEFFAWSPDGSRLWYAMLDRVAYSDDDGTTWFPSNTGLAANTPIPGDIAFDFQGGTYLGTEGGGLYDQSGGGLYFMPAGQTDWTHIGFLDATILDVAIAEPGGKRFIGVGSGVFAADQNEVLVPTELISDIGVTTFVVEPDPLDPTRWVTGGVGAFFDNAQIYVLTGDGQSFEKTFEKFGSGEVRAIAFDPGSPTTVLAGLFPAGFGNNAIIRSTNSGQNWTEIGGTAGWSTIDLAFDPHTPGRVIQLSQNNQWASSSNGGQSWGTLQPAWPGSGPALFLEFDPFVPGRLYRGDEGIGLQRSDNDGATWSPLGVALHDRSELLLHPQVPGLLWIGDDAGKLLASMDSGDTFTEIYDVFLDGKAGPLALDTSDGSVLIGTSGASTWELPLGAPFVVLGEGTPGTGGVVPRHFPSGALPEIGSTDFTLSGDRCAGGAVAIFGIGLTEVSVPLFGGTLFLFPPVAITATLPTGGVPGQPGTGSFDFPLALPNNPALAGVDLLSQFVVADPGSAHPSLVTLSPGLRTTIVP